MTKAANKTEVAPMPAEAPKRHLPMIKQVSASNAEAFVMCGASHVLPQNDAHNDYMYRGSEGHEPLAAAINKRTPKTTDRGVAMVKDFPLDLVLEGVGMRKAEGAYAVNVKEKSVRYIGMDVGRNYGELRKYEVPCTLDVQGYKDARLYIRDWKFGRTGAWWQLLVQCMAVAYGASPSDEPAGEVDAGFVFIEGETGGRVFTEDARIVSLEEIDEACDKMVVAWDRVEKFADHMAGFAEKGMAFQPNTVSGSWCTYCGAYDACPSKWAMSKALLGKLLGSEEALAEMTLDEKGRLWEVTREAKRVIENIQEALKGTAVLEGCLPLPSGKFLTMIECDGRVSVDKDLAAKKIRALGGSAEDVLGIMKRGRSYTTSKETNKRSER